MRWVRFAVFILIATVLQADLIDIIALGSVKPNLLLILLVFFSIYCNTTEAIITSFTIGFAADRIGSSMGPGILSFGVFGTLLAYLHQVIAIRQIPYQAAAIFVVGFLSGILAYLLGFFRSQPSLTNIFATYLGMPIYSALIGPFLFLPSAWWMNITTNRFKQN